MSHPTTLVLFDIDGTLLFPDGCGRIALEMAMHDVFGRAADLASHHFSGKTDWQSLAELLDLSDKTVQAHMPAFEEAAAYHLGRVIHQHNVRPCPGALALVEALNCEPAALVGLLTGNLRATAPIKLRAAGFDPGVFHVGAYGSEARLRAALPPIAIARAEQLTGARFSGRRVVIVGDTEYDVTCGRGVGARALAVATGFASRATLEAHQPDYLFDDLADLPAVMRAIFDSSEPTP